MRCVTYFDAMGDSEVCCILKAGPAAASIHPLEEIRLDHLEDMHEPRMRFRFLNYFFHDRPDSGDVAGVELRTVQATGPVRHGRRAQRKRRSIDSIAIGDETVRIEASLRRVQRRQQIEARPASKFRRQFQKCSRRRILRERRV